MIDAFKVCLFVPLRSEYEFWRLLSLLELLKLQCKMKWLAKILIRRKLIYLLARERKDQKKEEQTIIKFFLPALFIER